MGKHILKSIMTSMVIIITIVLIIGCDDKSTEDSKKGILLSVSLEILTDIILAVGRILGEAATLLYTAGMSATPLKFTANITSKFFPFNLMRLTERLSVYIWQINSESTVKDASRIADGAVAMLIIMVILFNILTRVIGKNIYRIYTGTN
ncbi:ABC transporter permease subunit [Clostridium niameyense]|uniref:ABC transporter permease subunit n=1 Tax=Clostridium niameyense TaxID=1622073 RepID=A0A6M0R704_9CLOT|nr:hypothetical protein [Clostridium niameyense]NEZ45996.1 ABC transporter permease subunit [Clostridium niameyense]